MKKLNNIVEDEYSISSLRRVKHMGYFFFHRENKVHISVYSYGTGDTLISAIYSQAKIKENHDQSTKITMNRIAQSNYIKQVWDRITNAEMLTTPQLLSMAKAQHDKKHNKKV